MQTYLVSNLLRTNTGRVGLLFCLMLIGFETTGACLVSSDPIEKDSLFSKWVKTKSTLPTLFYQLADFNDFADRVEAESLIRMYGIGGIMVSNGNSEELKSWMVNNQKWRIEPLVHIATIDEIFELPFDGLEDYPSQLSVECFTNDSLAYWLGEAHANDLRQMGFGLIEISKLPTYYAEQEYRKVAKYLEGLTSGRLSFFYGKQALSMISKWSFIDESNSKILHVSQVVRNGTLEKKTLKKYKKEEKDDRMVLDYSEDTRMTIQQIERGVGLLIISKQSKPQNLINALLVEGIPSKGFYRQQVKDYFGLLQETERTLSLPIDQLKNWTSLKYRFQFRDITLIQDPHQRLPITHFETGRLFTVSKNKEFEWRVDKYQVAQHLPVSTLQLDADSVGTLLPKEAVVLVDVSSLEDQELTTAMTFCDSLNRYRPVIVFVEGQEKVVKNGNWQSALVWNPNASFSRLAIMIEMVFGARGMSGALPSYYQKDHIQKGISIQARGRLTYFQTKASKVDQQVLTQIDTLIAQAIREEMMPGCQVMMVKDGQVVYDKSFGYLTYDSINPVRWDHVYDIASVTKTAATVPALMHRMDQGKLALNGQLGNYLSDIDSTKAQLTLTDILTHQSGLKSYLPFWRHAEYFADSASFLYKKKKWRRRYTYHVINWGDSIQSWIANSPYNSLSNVDGTYRYLYSDLGFMLMKDLVEENCQCSFEQSLEELVYRPMGMNYTTFNPLSRIPKEQIAPTEKDKYFRAELLQGIVHDKNAALLGGVSGHAGLFSNANDLAKYMQMLIQGGSYGGVQYFSDSVVRVFTSKKKEGDRRAMGWDKPYPSVGNASKYASSESFGHSGFTGTLIWADPKYNLVYIFLSNRIYPDPQNYKLIESNTRTKIHDLMYESFLNLDKETNPGS